MADFDTLVLGPGARDLLAPVLDVVRRGLSAPGDGLSGVRLGEVDGFWALDGATVVLSEGLLGPAMRHPVEVDEALGLDRWRRAAASVLEAAELLSLARGLQAAPEWDWRWAGAVLDRVDRAVPELALADRDLALAVRTGDPGSNPRAGLAAIRALPGDVDRLLGGELPAPAEWLAAGRWVFDPQAGPSLPVPVEPVADIRPGATLPAWSWRRLTVAPHTRGGRLTAGEEVAIAEEWVPARRRHRTLVAATAAARVVLSPGAPTGRWDLNSAGGFGQIFGGRGVQYGFDEDGSMEVILADSFVGPVAALEMSKTVGTSGLVTGRWEVAGEASMRFRGLDPSMLTLHGREEDSYAVPAQGLGPAQWLRAMCAEPWAWRIEGDRLFLNGRLFGGKIEVRLTAAD
jgi:hypothetical protein